MRPETIQNGPKKIRNRPKPSENDPKTSETVRNRPKPSENGPKTIENRPKPSKNEKWRRKVLRDAINFFLQLFFAIYFSITINSWPRIFFSFSR